MSWIEALILGIIQGLTEFLPVSSSGHLELGKHILGVTATDNLTFTVVVHGATVLSTLVVFRKSLLELLKGVFEFKWNEQTQYIFKIGVSMVPIAIVGFFFKDYVEDIFNSPEILLIVGSCLIFTALLLGFTNYKKQGDKEISFKHAFIIGVAQTIAVLPGVSRSGSTIATGLLLGNKSVDMARFSFLMVLVPILGENFLSILKADYAAPESISVVALLIGFVAAFVSGLLACNWMIRLVKNGKLIYFAIYCAVVGVLALGSQLFF
ncbi:undecaprenyl-diphosphate phosphatase [Marinilabiliaceae bacterium JC017]|nr:undecaprenyl-diphosphate phosphatase [Marinilabiliaceae bacterium JC017]